jgi:uncharacterized protein (DUF362 family)
MRRPTVILRRCESYDVEAIRGIVREAMETLDLRPRGRTLVKPNCVASGQYFPHAYTRPEFLEGVFLALKDRSTGEVSELALGERSGITMPCRYAFKGAGYYPLAERLGIELHHFDEVQQVEVKLSHPERLRDSIYVPEPVARADFFVNCPKFKAHPWTTVTFSMKNYIGIQDDRHRLIDHDHRLHEKVRDLQFVLQPQLIAIDAITAGEGRMLTPKPFHLGLVICGDNQLAVDAVGCAILGIDPLSVEHLRLAFESGFGPVDLRDIRLLGDVALEDAQKRARTFEKGLIRVEDYFSKTNIRAYAGPPPTDGGHDYCWGGCPGALEEAIEILRMYDASTDDKMPPVHIVFGAYQGAIPAKPDERVVFIGDCTSWNGDLAGKPVQIASTYVDRSKKNPLDAARPDIFGKMIGTETLLWKARNDQVIRMTGCPVSVAEHVLALVKLGGLKNPYFDPGEVFSFTSAYLSFRTRNAIARLFGKPYNVPGFEGRGEASRMPMDEPSGNGR